MNVLKDVQTAADYAEFERRFAQFMDKENLTHLCGGHLRCPECDTPGTDDESCPECGEAYNEPFFSWSSCDCCNRPLSGDREHASGCNRDTGEVQEYSGVCQDCLYYAEYGKLDDMTMLNVENNA